MPSELTTNPQPDVLDTQAVLDRVYSKDPSVRSMVQREMSAAPFNYIDALIAIFERERRQKRRRLLPLSAFYYGLMIAILLFTRIGWDPVSPFGLAVLLAALSLTTERQKQAARWLSEVDDVRAVGPLLDVFDKEDFTSKPYARSALTRLLPKLKSSDRALLTDEQRASLFRTLGASHDADYQLAALKALEQVGDGRAADTVRKLASSEELKMQHPEVYQAAEECLPVLLERQEAEKESNLLLRPAESQETVEAALLRPAAASESDEATLLRAASSTTAPP